MIREYEIEEFAEMLSSTNPTPGGGGAAAVSGALGASLCLMASNLTFGKKKYAVYEADLLEDNRMLEDFRETFYRLADKDEEVFLPLSKAYALPKNTEEEKALRDKVMENALADASTVPLSCMETAEAALKAALDIAGKASKLSVSDVGVGGSFLYTALEGASLNVLINVRSMKREDVKTHLMTRVNALLRSGKESYEAIERIVKERIS